MYSECQRDGKVRDRGLNIYSRITNTNTKTELNSWCIIIFFFSPYFLTTLSPAPPCIYNFHFSPYSLLSLLLLFLYSVLYNNLVFSVKMIYFRCNEKVEDIFLSLFLSVKNQSLSRLTFRRSMNSPKNHLTTLKTHSKINHPLSELTRNLFAYKTLTLSRSQKNHLQDTHFQDSLRNLSITLKTLSKPLHLKDSHYQVLITYRALTLRFSLSLWNWIHF